MLSTHTAMRQLWWCIALAVVGERAGWCQVPPSDSTQYQWDNIVVPAASGQEPVRGNVSLELARDYVERAALAWSKSRKCVSCHTNGCYLQIRPALISALGPPSDELRRFFVEQLNELEATKRADLMEGLRPAQVAYLAAGLAEWDAHVTKKRSSETERALQLLFAVQHEDGSWGNAICWPPLESSSFHATTVAAMAAAAAPDWLDTLQDGDLSSGVQRMLRYLRETKPAHDYDRVLLLWTSTRLVDLLNEQQRDSIMAMIWQHQRPDGGWSIRSFAQPEAWGSGNRAEKLRGEPEFSDPPSDGHQTGLVVFVLRDAGVAADDPRLQKAVQWLQANQRASGRWWTRSLNTDRFHFITYSGTLYPLLALHKCGALPERALDND